MGNDDLAKLQEAILEVIRIQLRDNRPPATRLTLDRLISEGLSEKKAMRLIGHVVAAELSGVIGEGRQYDEQSYIRALQALPELPWKKQGPRLE